jgi:hypothetical protein
MLVRKESSPQKIRRLRLSAPGWIRQVGLLPLTLLPLSAAIPLWIWTLLPLTTAIPRQILPRFLNPQFLLRVLRPVYQKFLQNQN